jgi:hypothetical protein
MRVIVYGNRLRDRMIAIQFCMLRFEAATSAAEGFRSTPSERHSPTRRYNCVSYSAGTSL